MQQVSDKPSFPEKNRELFIKLITARHEVERLTSREASSLSSTETLRKKEIEARLEELVNTKIRKDSPEIFEQGELNVELQKLVTVDEDQLSSADRRSLRRHRSQIQELTTEIITFNRPLVRRATKLFVMHAKASDAEEYEIAGLAGLMKAISTYNPDKGAWSSWAMRDIKRERNRIVAFTEHPNMSSGVYEARPVIRKARENLISANPDAEPTYEEIAKEATRLSVPKSGKKRTVTVETVALALSPPSLISIQNSVSGTEDATLEDILEDPGPSFDTSVVQAGDFALMETLALTVLDPREHFVFVRRSGLDGEPPMNHSTIAALFGISRETARNINEKAMAKILHPTTLRKLALAAMTHRDSQ